MHTRPHGSASIATGVGVLPRTISSEPAPTSVTAAIAPHIHIGSTGAEDGGAVGCGTIGDVSAAFAAVVTATMRRRRPSALTLVGLRWITSSIFARALP